MARCHSKNYCPAKDEFVSTLRVSSPGIWWIGLMMNLSGSEVQTLQTNLWGVRPLSVLSRRAKLWRRC